MLCWLKSRRGGEEANAHTSDVEDGSEKDGEREREGVGWCGGGAAHLHAQSLELAALLEADHGREAEAGHTAARAHLPGAAQHAESAVRTQARKARTEHLLN